MSAGGPAAAAALAASAASDELTLQLLRQLAAARPGARARHSLGYALNMQHQGQPDALSPRARSVRSSTTRSLTLQLADDTVSGLAAVSYLYSPTRTGTGAAAAPYINSVMSTLSPSFSIARTPRTSGVYGALSPQHTSMTGRHANAAIAAAAAAAVAAVDGNAKNQFSRRSTASNLASPNNVEADAVRRQRSQTAGPAAPLFVQAWVETHAAAMHSLNAPDVQPSPFSLPYTSVTRGRHPSPDQARPSGLLTVLGAASPRQQLSAQSTGLVTAGPEPDPSMDSGPSPSPAAATPSVAAKGTTQELVAPMVSALATTPDASPGPLLAPRISPGAMGASRLASATDRYAAAMKALWPEPGGSKHGGIPRPDSRSQHAPGLGKAGLAGPTHSHISLSAALDRRRSRSALPARLSRRRSSSKERCEGDAEAGTKGAPGGVVVLKGPAHLALEDQYSVLLQDFKVQSDVMPLACPLTPHADRPWACVRAAGASSLSSHCAACLTAKVPWLMPTLFSPACVSLVAAVCPEAALTHSVC